MDAICSKNIFSILKEPCFSVYLYLYGALIHCMNFIIFMNIYKYINSLNVISNEINDFNL